MAQELTHQSVEFLTAAADTTIVDTDIAERVGQHVSNGVLSGEIPFTPGEDIDNLMITTHAAALMKIRALRDITRSALGNGEQIDPILSYKHFQQLCLLGKRPEESEEEKILFRTLVEQPKKFRAEDDANTVRRVRFATIFHSLGLFAVNGTHQAMLTMYAERISRPDSPAAIFRAWWLPLEQSQTTATTVR